MMNQIVPFKLELAYFDRTEEFLDFYRVENQKDCVVYYILKFFLILKSLQDQGLIREYVECDQDIYKFTDVLKGVEMEDYIMDLILDESLFENDIKEKLKSFVHAVEN